MASFTTYAEEEEVHFVCCLEREESDRKRTGTSCCWLPTVLHSTGHFGCEQLTLMDDRKNKWSLMQCPTSSSDFTALMHTTPNDSTAWYGAKYILISCACRRLILLLSLSAMRHRTRLLSRVFNLSIHQYAQPVL